ncbi:acyltransferase [Granulicella mallensis]|uniref:Peptidoglycan/LPS O-acetylase OafA/YrhL n=1 Tax=Granulicella mallensis TaxID=940614 RepID=A0A7W8E833_9BACT|nr:acyltransferase [Granulicella mallensis]MBB5062417.1 peptidoglycan/LPS O-acetylase OafA/YrhL [Granulicella mallensis]
MQVSQLDQQESSRSKFKGESSRHYPALDGLRGIAILAVFCYHFGGGSKSSNWLIQIWSGIADTGWMGVDLFFVLSGFLITGILYDTAHKPNRVKNFYARRSLRIFPLYYGVLLLFLLLTPVLQLHWKPGHLLYFFYLSNMMPLFTPGLASPGPKMMVGHFWTLAVEEQFYLVWPFIVWHVRDRRRLLQVSVAIMLAALILRIILVYRGVTFFHIFPLLPTRIDTLVCGGIAALLVRGPLPERIPVKRVFVVSSLTTLIVLISMRFTTHGNQVLATFGYTVVAVCFACLVFFAQQGRGWIARIGRLRFLRFFGRYSYGLYIYHGLLFVFLVQAVHPIQRLVHSDLLGGAIVVISSLAITLGAAILSYHYFEAPILNLKKRFS